jgi:bifunctional non-homologous end joining protein LigD
MKATLGSLPSSDDGWAFEIKWDGHRTLAHVERGNTKLQTTAGHDSTERWPEVAALGGAVNAATAIIDGEMLVVGEDGRPSFDLVQRRDPAKHPALFHAFDVLSIDGTDTVTLPYLDRRSLLDQVLDPGPHWAIPAHHVGGGAALLEATIDQQLEGLIAKRTDSIYRPGTRTKDWLKIKNRIRTDVMVGGFSAGAGARSSTFGSLLVGVPDGTRLRFAGGVGTGFTQTTLERLMARMRPLATANCPFDPEPPAAIRRTATWVKPDLTATIEIAEFTNDGHVRHASFVQLQEP